jgi:hypothetical protein
MVSINDPCIYRHEKAKASLLKTSVLKRKAETKEEDSDPNKKAKRETVVISFSDDEDDDMDLVKDTISRAHDNEMVREDAWLLLFVLCMFSPFSDNAPTPGSLSYMNHVVWHELITHIYSLKYIQVKEMQRRHNQALAQIEISKKNAESSPVKPMMGDSYSLLDDDDEEEDDIPRHKEIVPVVQEVAPDIGMVLKIRLRDKSDGSFFPKKMKIGYKQQFALIREAFANQMNEHFQDDEKVRVTLFFDGMIVPDDATPQSLEMDEEDGQILDFLFDEK